MRAGDVLKALSLLGREELLTVIDDRISADRPEKITYLWPRLTTAVRADPEQSECSDPPLRFSRR